MTAIKKVTESSLQALSTSAITEMYNEIAGRIGMNVVKRFSDKSTAIKRALAAATAEAEAAKAEAKRVRAEAKANGIAVVKEPKAPREPKPQTIRNKGPRGFRVDSPAWMKSVVEAKGIATLPANFPKLKDTATVYGIDAEKIETMSQAELIVATSAAVAAMPTPVVEELPKVVHEGFKETPAAE